MPSKTRILLFITSAIFLVCSFMVAANANECDALQPNKPIVSEIRDKLTIEAGVLRHWIGTGELTNEYKQIEHDILSDYPNADQLHIWKSFIYFACQDIFSGNYSKEERKDYLHDLISQYRSFTLSTLQSDLTNSDSSTKLLKFDEAMQSDDTGVASLALHTGLTSSDRLLQGRAVRHIMSNVESMSGTWIGKRDKDANGMFGFIIKDKEITPTGVKFTGNFQGNGFYFTVHPDKAVGTVNGTRLIIASESCNVNAQFDGIASFIGDIDCYLKYEKGRYTGNATIDIPIY